MSSGRKWYGQHVPFWWVQVS